MLNGLGQGTSYNPSNPGFFSRNPVLDPVILETEVTPENALTRAKELDAARLMLEQQRKEIEIEKARILATQKRLDEQESRLRQNINTTEDRLDDITQTYQGKQQSRFPLRGELLNPTALFTRESIHETHAENPSSKRKQHYQVSRVTC